VSPGPEWTLVWADEFDLPDGSRLNPEFWNYATGTGSGGWGNNESQYYTDRIENSFIEDGKLVIQALEEAHMGAQYTSARVNTMGKKDFLYGRFEARAKLPNTQGIWPAIWMMPADSKYGIWPESGEIDIVEMIGRDPYVVHGTIHYGNPKGSRTESYFLPTYETFDQDFHIFVLEWEPEEFRWYVDGEQFHEAKSNEWYTTNPDAPPTAPFDQPFYLLLNVAVGGNWPGYPNETSEFPQRMEVDYVRVYQKLSE
jgi:beta-glucanase (GH16 family)